MNIDLCYESPAPGIAGAVCKNCKETKPLADFKRKLTLAQSKARGYAGGVRLEIESSLCKACQPKRKPLAERSRKELHNLTVSGELRTAVVEGMIEKRKALAKRNQAEGAAKRWRNEVAKPMRDHLTQEIGRCMQARNYHVNRAVRPEISAEAAAFYDKYLPFLRGIRARLDSKAQTDIKALRTVQHWLELCDPDAKAALVEAWRALPIEVHMAARRRPELLRPTAIPADPRLQPPAELPSERARRLQDEEDRRQAEAAARERSSTPEADLFD